MKKNIFIIAVIFASKSIFASSVQGTKITEVLVGPSYGTKVILTVSKVAADEPECRTNDGYNYVFDASTESGKITLSVALAAYASKTNVWMGGYGSCTLYDGIEDLKHIVAQ